MCSAGLADEGAHPPPIHPTIHPPPARPPHPASRGSAGLGGASQPLRRCWESRHLCQKPPGSERHPIKRWSGRRNRGGLINSPRLIQKIRISTYTHILTRPQGGGQWPARRRCAAGGQTEPQHSVALGAARTAPGATGRGPGGASAYGALCTPVHGCSISPPSSSSSSCSPSAPCRCWSAGRSSAVACPSRWVCRLGLSGVCAHAACWLRQLGPNPWRLEASPLGKPWRRADGAPGTGLCELSPSVRRAAR
jgi:hypothetical protein